MPLISYLWLLGRQLPVSYPLTYRRIAKILVATVIIITACIATITGFIAYVILKGTVHPKIKMLLLFTHLHIVPNQKKIF